MPIAFGADSVASALHLRHGRDPAADEARLPRPRPGLDQNRNFLLCLDSRMDSGMDGVCPLKRPLKKLAAGKQKGM